MISLFVRHRNAANLLMIVMVAAGLVALSRLNTQFFPTLSFDTIEISVVWPGATASDVESAIIQRIEPDIRTITGVDKVQSTSREGGGEIIIEFVEGSDMQAALSDVEAAVNQVQGLPTDMEDPEVKRIVRYEPVGRLIVSGSVSEQAISETARAIRNDLLARGIDRVDYGGRRDPEIHIGLSEETLRRLNLSIEDVADRVEETALDRPLGDFGTGAEVQARIQQRRDYADALADVVVIPDAAGGGTTLGEIATLENAFDDDDPEYRYGEQRAIELIVQRVPTADALEAQATLRTYLNEKAGTWPASIHVELYDVTADLIKQRVDLLITNGIGGLIIVLLLLFLFLEARITFWIALGIPVALCATAATMLVMGQSINMISLFGLIMALGIVVDDAIVVGEHADHLRAQGLPPQQAAELGARRMAIPVIAASLTTIATFLPILLIGDVIGQIIGAIPLVIVAVLLASLVECFLILPSHMRDALGAGTRRGPAAWRRRFDAAFDRFRFGPFRRAIAFFLRWRYATIAGMVAMLILAVGLMAGGRVPFLFFKGPEAETIQGTVRFAPGTPRETTLAMLERMHAALAPAEARTPDGPGKVVNTALIRVGDGGDHKGELQVELVSSDQRETRTSQFIKLWRQEIEPMPGVESLLLREQQGGPPGRDIDIRISGGEPERLKAAALKMAEVVESFAGTFAVDDDLPYGKAEAELSLTPFGRSLGFTHEDVARQLRNALEGAIVDRFARGEDEVKVRVRLARADQSDDVLARLRLITPGGGEAALEDIVDIKRTVGFNIIKRENGVREVALTADVDDAVANAGEIRAALGKTGLDRIAAEMGVTWRLSGRAEERRDTFADMRLGGILGLATVYIVLAWALASYTRPILVMAIIPFGLMGAIVGHWLLGYTMMILSLVALLGLAGILVNDSVILMTTIDRRVRDEGEAPGEAVLDAAVERLRPVILTSLTTIGGLLPLLFETSRQAQFLIPMVITLVFGLATASLLVLVLVPSLVMVGEDVKTIRTRLGRLLRRQPAAPSATEATPTG